MANKSIHIKRADRIGSERLTGGQMNIGEFGQMRFYYMQENRNHMLKRLIKDKKLKRYLKKFDERAWVMTKEIERSLKRSSETLRNKKDHNIIEITVERKRIKNTAVNFVKKEYVCR